MGHSSRMMFETKSATAMLRSNLIQSIEFGTAVAWCLKRASLGTNVNTPFFQVPTLEFRNSAGAETLYLGTKVGTRSLCAQHFCYFWSSPSLCTRCYSLTIDKMLST